jgi:hypothetical protein
MPLLAALQSRFSLPAGIAPYLTEIVGEMGKSAMFSPG